MAGERSVSKRKVSIFGKQFSLTQEVSSDMGLPMDLSVVAAKTGTLSTRTDDNTGTLTMTGGHGITDAAKVDVYWSGGKRRGMTVGTVATNSVPIDGGTGDVLPIATTAVTVQVVRDENATFAAADCTGIFFQVQGNERATIVLIDDADAEVLHIPLDAGEAYIWQSSDNGDSPIDGGGTIAKIRVTQEDSTAAVRVYGAIQYN